MLTNTMDQILFLEASKSSASQYIIGILRKFPYSPIHNSPSLFTSREPDYT